MLRFVSTLLGFGVSAVLVLCIAALGLYAWLAPDLPGQERIDNTRLKQPLRVYSSEGLLIAEFGRERRAPLAFEATPPMLIKAFLAAEDQRFFEHPGVDFRALLRAARDLMRSGRIRQGGSTITMQLARNLYLGRQKTFRRKLTELLIALRLEAQLSKQRIFELYQNKIFFGSRAYGVSAAAQTYYGKPVTQLSLAQMAMLAGLPQAPSAHNPLSSPEQARRRRDLVLMRMFHLGYIDEPQYLQAVGQADDAALHRPQPELHAPHVAEMVRQELLRRFGDQALESGLRATTTIDARRQRLANAALRNSLLDYERRHAYRHSPVSLPDRPQYAWRELDELLAEQQPIQGLRPAIVTRLGAQGGELYLGERTRAELNLKDRSWAGRELTAGQLVWLREDSARLSQPPAVQGALLALSPRDGAIQALVGGYDYRLSQFNRAVDARRQPGSAFKPLVYAAALSRGWTPATLLDDSPVEIADGSGGVWRPGNFDGQFLGPVRLRESLALSRNLAAVNLLQSVGLKEAREYLARFGFNASDLPKGLSLVLGSGETSPLRMAGAYARFANGGFAVEPYLIREVRDAEGLLVSHAEPAVVAARFEGGAQALPAQGHAASRVLESRLAWQMHSLLQEVIREGTGKRALQLGRTDLAGKTGTSNQVRDSWFCGYQPELVTVAWMGKDDFKPLGRRETGGRAALAMWMEFMGPALQGQAERHPQEPQGLAHVWINRYSGQLSAAEDPDALAESVREEYEVMLLGPAREQAERAGMGAAGKTARENLMPIPAMPARLSKPRPEETTESRQESLRSRNEELLQDLF